FDKEGNYLVSMPIEDQIWKIDRKSGKLEWKFGRNGDFAMDTAAYFSFQHTPYITPEGDLALFDNGLLKLRSGAKVFRLDEKARTAKTVLNVPLPAEKYTSRMGSAYILPNGNLLQTSSKTGSIMVTDKSGKVLWESIMAYAPYRALYIPMETWSKYFTEIK
ncbi:MAG: arylsulfotransferase family protein, partial [Tannerellaceae bacterium]